MFLRRHPLFSLLSLLLLAGLACTTLLGEPPPPLPAPPTLMINTPPPATPAGGSLAPTVTPIATPATTGATVRALVDVNIRTGPGIQYGRDGFLLAGESAFITGRDPSSGWWQIQCPPRADGPNCWVTGGSRYTSASNTQDVPVALVPPTPTSPASSTPPAASTQTAGGGQDGDQPLPAATLPAGGNLLGSPLLVYVNDGLINLMRLLPAGELLTAGPITQVDPGGPVSALTIAPNGQQIAYLQDNGNQNALYLVSAGGGSPLPLVSTADLPQGRVIDQVQWLANSQSLAFSTRSDLGGSPAGLPNAADLWLVSPGNPAREIYPAGSGGGTFTLSGQDELLFSRPGDIARGRLDGSQFLPVLTFTPPNTGSEFAYLPQPQWLADSSARVAIPTQGPLGRNTGAALWRIPAGEPGQQVGSLNGNILNNPIIWSPDGARLAYVRQSPALARQSLELLLADGQGQEPQSYALGAALGFLAWNPAGTTFLYRGDGFYAVGAPDQPPLSTLLPAGSAVQSGQWLTPNNFLVIVGSTGNWQIIGGTPAGAAIPLVTLSDPLPVYAAWSP